MAKALKIREEEKKGEQRPNFIQRYLRETMGELHKVTWPTRHEATNLTIVVIIVIAAMSTFLAVLDIIFARLFALILKG
jgi:preprotein translocase subunit SecE